MENKNKVTIKETHYQVLPKEEQRMLYVNGSIIPFYMGWDNATQCWKFVDENVPEHIRESESEISYFIEGSDFKHL